MITVMNETNALRRRNKPGFVSAWLMLVPGLFKSLSSWWMKAQSNKESDSDAEMPPITPKQRQERAALFAQAFDAVLTDLMAIHRPHAKGDLNSESAARMAIKANTMHCGPVARQVEAHLLARGVSGVSFHSLQGQFVVVDAVTGLLHDLETYQGVSRKEDLPIRQRKATPEAMAQAAKAWQIQRQQALQSFYLNGATP